MRRYGFAGKALLEFYPEICILVYTNPQQMKPKLTCIAFVAIPFILAISGCSDPEIKPGPVSVKEKDFLGPPDFSTMSFTTYKWFTFFPRSLAQTQYNRSVSSTGTSWSGVANITTVKFYLSGVD
jgi:hypothetical protein